MSEIRGDLQQESPRWRVPDTQRLALIIKGVCGIRKEVADQIVAELLESESKAAQFETQTILVGKPNLSRTRSTWVARQVTWSGVGKYTGYELVRKQRTEG
jgi:hypothetical protein